MSLFLLFFNSYSPSNCLRGSVGLINLYFYKHPLNKHFALSLRLSVTQEKGLLHRELNLNMPFNTRL